MRTGRPVPQLTLTQEERKTLEQWSRRPNTAQALAQRSRVILSCAIGKTNTAVSAEVGLSKPAVGKWRTRFVERRLDGLLDKPRPGIRRTIGDADVEHVLTLTLETTPVDATHWSTRSMAQQSGLSQSTISRIWRAFAFQPHRTEGFQLSKDPLFFIGWELCMLSLIRDTSRVLKNPFDHPPGPLPGQEGGKRYIWGVPPYPHQRGFAPLDSSFSAACSSTLQRGVLNIAAGQQDSSTGRHKLSRAARGGAMSLQKQEREVSFETV